MRISKKILSVVLAVLMLVSICLVPSVAASPLDGNEDSAKINVKYEVEQINTAYDGLLVTEGKDIYAVSIYAKAQYGINVVQVPLYYDADLFAPIMWADDAPVDNGALGYDGWYADNGEDLIYDYSKGDAWSDTSWYRSNGNAASSTGNARFIGLGRSEAAVIKLEAAYVESSNEAKYDAYTTVPDDNFDGYMYFQFINKTSKTAYCNAIENVVVNDYVRLATFYFMRQEGVSEEDCLGAQFGWCEGGNWLTQTDWDTSGKPSYFASTYNQGVPGVQYVSNAVVEAQATSIVNPMKGQIRFDKNADNTYAGTFDIRAIAKITGEDFTKTFGSIANAEANITSVGFVFAQGTGNYDDMKAVAQAGASGNGYTYAPVDFISTSFDPGNYTFSCIVDNVNDKNDSLVALAYIKYVDADGATQWAFYTDVQTVPFAGLYDTYYGEVFGA